MRLYKDIKVELKATIKIIVEENLSCNATIKKYNGKTSIVSENAQSESEFRRLMNEILNESNIANKVVDTNDNAIQIQNIQRINFNIYSRNDRMKEINRTNATLYKVYKANASYDITLFIYGRLYIGGYSSEFEDCFETRSGIRLGEIIDNEFIERYIKTTYEKNSGDKHKNGSISTEVHYQFNDNVKLLQDENEFRDTVYANKDAIVNIIGDDIDNRHYHNPLDE